MSVEVTDNNDLGRYEARVDGELAGFADYRLEGRRITILHTEVDDSHERQGVATHLTSVLLNDIRSRELELVPRCPFTAAYVREHPDLYLPLVPEDLRDRVMSGS